LAQVFFALRPLREVLSFSMSVSTFNQIR